jgi:acetyl esterase/lipase
MKKICHAFGLALAVLPCLSAWAAEGELLFDPARFELKKISVDGREISVRAYEKILYVARPVEPDYQSMNVYIPVEYFEGKKIGGYSAETAPIFLPNSVGGYLPGKASGTEPGFGGQSTVARALAHGYVVAAPGARGRTLQSPAGDYTGKAPAAIVDLKAAVRYLKFNDARMPGDANRIVSNGTSAGGALSALLGATGNQPDYEPYLHELGAAPGRDDIFAVSAYCPITNLEEADKAYEWMFLGVNEAKPVARGSRPAPMTAPAGDRPQGAPLMQSGKMTAEQIAHSQALAALFPAYVNSLNLKDHEGRDLRLDTLGDGLFKTHLKTLIMVSAQKALDQGRDLSAAKWLTIKDGKVMAMDWPAYVADIGRMKLTSAFDGTTLATGENSLFGSDKINARHFSDFGVAHSSVKGDRAPAGVVKMMNPMAYLGSAGVAPNWRIRHGEADRDTSVAIPAILSVRLAQSGVKVDFAVPWAQGHGGDYDLDELFDWIDGLMQSAR